jgi:hypothetical protein
MAEQRLPGRDGTVTVIHDSNAPFGEINGVPEPPDDPSKWHSKRIKDIDYQKRRGWTDEQFATARDYCGFPAGQLMQRAKRFSWTRSGRNTRRPTSRSGNRGSEV